MNGTISTHPIMIHVVKSTNYESVTQCVCPPVTSSHF